jgi:hypothetical protein
VGILCTLLLVSACSSSAPQETIRPVETVVVRTVEVPRPAPIVPNPDVVEMKPVTWIVITPENVDQKFAELRGSEKVFFAIPASAYEALSLNLADIMKLIQQQNQIIQLYRKYFE